MEKIMKQNNSAIMQMMLGNRGNLESVRRSNEWKEACKLSLKKLEEFEKQLKDCAPHLYALYEELHEAEADLNAIFIEDVYKEAFAFGLAIGQEVFDR